MLPNAVIEQMSPDSLWMNSHKVVWNCVSAGKDTGFPIWILLIAALFLFIATSRYIFPYLSDKLPLIFQPMAYQVPLPTRFMAALLFITMFSCCLLAGSICFLSFADKVFFWRILVYLLMLITLKGSILVLAQEASGAQCLMACLRAMMVLISSIAAITALFSLTALLAPEARDTGTFTLALACISILAVLLYLYKVFITLFSAKISPFYTFLYLCTLEFIPLSVMAVAITRL